MCQERFHPEVTLEIRLRGWAGILEEGKKEELQMEGLACAKAQNHENAWQAGEGELSGTV